MRLVLRLILAIALGWSFAKLIEFSPPPWKAFATWFPPVVITLLVAFGFGRSLFRGEALVTRIARAHHEGGLPDDLVGYTRRLTAVWAYFLLGCALFTVLLVQYAGFPAAASLTPVMVPCLMVGEYFFRKRRYRQHSHRTPLSLMLFMLRHGMPRD